MALKLSCPRWPGPGVRRALRAGGAAGRARAPERDPDLRARRGRRSAVHGDALVAGGDLAARLRGTAGLDPRGRGRDPGTGRRALDAAHRRRRASRHQARERPARRRARVADGFRRGQGHGRPRHATGPGAGWERSATWRPSCSTAPTRAGRRRLLARVRAVRGADRPRAVPARHRGRDAVGAPLRAAAVDDRRPPGAAARARRRAAADAGEGAGGAARKRGRGLARRPRRADGAAAGGRDGGGGDAAGRRQRVVAERRCRPDVAGRRRVAERRRPAPSARRPPRRASPSR